LTLCVVAVVMFFQEWQLLLGVLLVACVLVYSGSHVLYGWRLHQRYVRAAEELREAAEALEAQKK
jgi:hypothetical protein